jgi:hypothetical protein
MKFAMKLVAFNFGILFAGVLVAEIIFGSWFGAPQLWSLGVVRDINWKYNVPGTYRRDSPVHYTRDKWGLRGDFGAPKNVEIVAVGGSTTDEGRVSNHEAWPEILEACLKSNGIKMDIANAGVGGQSSLGHALNFKKWFNYIPNFNPKYALIFLGYNDVLRAGMEGQQDPLTFTGLSNNSNYHKLKKWVKINSAIYNLIQIIKGNVIAWNADLGPVREIRSFISPIDINSYEVDVRDKIYKLRKYVKIGSTVYNETRDISLSKYSENLKSYRKRLKELDEAALEFGTIPIYVTQNDWGYWREEDRIYGNLAGYHLFNNLNNVTRSFCKTKRRFCVDLAGQYYFGPGDIYDHIHTTVQGSKKIGNKICKPLSKWFLTNGYF